MLAYLIRRLLQSVGVLLAVSVVVFLGIYAVGNPAAILLPDDATGAELEAAMRNLGLDRPLPLQYFTFLGNALRGDLGTSFVFNAPSIQLILARLPATLELAITAMALAVLLGIPLGLWAGLKPGSGSRPVGRHTGDQRAARRAKSKTVRNLRRHRLDPHTDPAAPRLAIFEYLRKDGPHSTGGNGKADADGRA